MNKLEGKKQQQIASELQISINTVESQMAIAYKKLREELKDCLPLLLFYLLFPDFFIFFWRILSLASFTIQNR